MTATLADRFRAHCEAARLFPESGVAVVAVSGGPDSVALLDLLHGAAAALELTLVVAHADHGIQPASRAVAETVARLAARLGLPFELGELALGPGTIETAAPRTRYTWLRDVQAARAARYLVTAHHQDDQVETVLLRVLRGSAPAGLAGMTARARGGLVRPLLPFSRAELAAHVAARGLAAHDDPANRDPVHLRSWVRGTLLPFLDGRLEVRRASRAGRPAAAVPGGTPRGSATFGDYRVEWRPEAAPPRLERAGWTTWLAAEPGEWCVRSPRRGDLVTPLGGIGRRPLRRLFMDARVP